MKDAEKHGVVDLDVPENDLPAEEVEDLNVEEYSMEDLDRKEDNLPTS